MPTIIDFFPHQYIQYEKKILNYVLKRVHIDCNHMSKNFMQRTVILKRFFNQILCFYIRCALLSNNILSVNFPPQKLRAGCD